MSSVETLGGLQRRLNVSIPQPQLRGEVESRLKRLGGQSKCMAFVRVKSPSKLLSNSMGSKSTRKCWAKACSDRSRRQFRQISRKSPDITI